MLGHLWHKDCKNLRQGTYYQMSTNNSAQTPEAVTCEGPHFVIIYLFVCQQINITILNLSISFRTWHALANEGSSHPLMFTSAIDRQTNLHLTQCCAAQLDLASKAWNWCLGNTCHPQNDWLAQQHLGCCCVCNQRDVQWLVKCLHL